MKNSQKKGVALGIAVVVCLIAIMLMFAMSSLYYTTIGFWISNLRLGSTFSQIINLVLGIIYILLAFLLPYKISLNILGYEDEE